MTDKPGIRNFLARFTPYLTRQASGVAAAYGLSLLGVALALTLPWPLKFMIDDVLAGANSLAALQNYSIAQQVIVLATAMVILASLVAVVLAAEKIQHAKVRERFGYWLRDDLVQQLYRLNRFSRQKEKSGELTMRLVSDTQLVSRLFCKTIPMTLKNIATAVITLVTIMIINVPIGVVALLMAGVLAAIVVAKGPQLTAAAATKRDREGRVAALTQETINGIEHVQAMALEEQSRHRYLEEAAESLRAGVNEVRVAVGLERNSQYAAGLALALVAGIGGVAVANNQLSLGTLTVCIAYIAQLLKPVEKINQTATSISRGIARADRIQKLFQAGTVIAPSNKAIRPDVIRHIDCIDLGFSYPHDEHPTVSGFCHSFRMGECTVLTGPSGSGKSTVLRLILGLHAPDHGRMSVNGKDYRNIDTVALRSQFAVLLQDAHLFAGSIREILTELRSDIGNDQLRQVLADVRLLELIDSLPDGIDTLIDEAGSRISGGQRARLLLARALVSRRPVLILDEPFANLDAESTRIIKNRIAIAKLDHVVIIVSHEMDLLAIADKVVTPAEFRSGTRRSSSQQIPRMQFCEVANVD